MAGTRKLGRPTDQRLAMLKSLTTDLILNGKIVTTEARAKEVKAMTSEELVKKLAELKSELFNLRFRLASGQLENPVSIRTCKRDIARINTEIRARELKA